MRHGDDRNYRIVKVNQKTGEESEVAVVKGRTAADSFSSRCEARLTDKEREDGWAISAEETTLPAMNSRG
jgi:hypothetical protein